MKKIVSLLAVALFATTFAAGCGKYTKCEEASKEDCSKADKFESDKGDKGNCVWNDKADNGKGKCEKKADAPATPANPDAADAAKCAAVTTGQADCEKVTLANAKKECKFNAGKCEMKDKP